jgi:hypothetical protein
MWAALCSPCFCQNESKPIYRVAKIEGIDPKDAADADAFIDAWTTAIEIELQKNIDSTHKPMGECCGPSSKPPHCEEISATLETADPRVKVVRVHVEEHWPNRPALGGEVTASGGLTCAPSVSNINCYRALKKSMARAVANHDADCHRGQKCTLVNGRFEPLP